MRMTGMRCRNQLGGRGGLRRFLCDAQQPFSSASSSQEYDVVIAGGGVMGCSAAYHLASTSKLKIAVVERDNTVWSLFAIAL